MVVNKTNLLVSFLTIFIVTSIINNGILPSGINYILFLFFIIVSGFFTIKPYSLSLPPYYWIGLLGLLICIVVNYRISRYSPPLFYVLYSAYYILQPIIVFIICYNILLSSKKINILLDKCLIALVLIVNFCIFVEIGKIFLGSEVINWKGEGFAASTAVQGIVMSFCLILKNKKKSKRYFQYIFILSFFVILTIQLKATGGIILVFIIYKIYTQRNRMKLILSLIFIIPIFLYSVLLIPEINTKVGKYMEWYTFTENSQIARVALYQTAFEIVNDQFPFGTGIGTYGTPAVNIHESKVYSDYGIDHIHGISYKYDVDFRLDALWSSLIGELGLAGIIFYLFLILYPIFYYHSSHFNNCRKKYYMFYIFTSTLIVILESFVLTNLLRLNFIFIYSGISALMIRSTLYEYNSDHKMLAASCSESNKILSAQQ